MRVEIPICTRCCFCLPLRRGIIILGYLHLAFALFAVSAETWLVAGRNLSRTTNTLYKGVIMWVTAWFPLVLYILEIIFNVLLLIGAHTRRIIFMKIFYYYCITTTMAAFMSFVVDRIMYPYISYYIDYFDLSLVFCGMVIQIYLIFMIRSELNKRRYQSGSEYVNHIITEALEPPSAWSETRIPV